MEEKNNQVQTKEKPIKKKKIRPIIVFIFAIVVAIIAYVMLRGTYLETYELGEQYVNSFWLNVNYMSTTFIINFLVIFILMYITNTRIKKGLTEFFEQENKPMPKLLNKSISFIVAILVSMLTSNFIMEKALMCFNSIEFGMSDPVFGIDISYFVFIQPFIELILWYAMIAVVALTIYSIIYYIITFNMFFDGIDRQTLKKSKLIQQLTGNIMILAVIFATFVFVQTFDIETSKFLSLENDSTTYSLYGAGFADVTIKLWGYRILAVVIIVSVYLGIKYFKQGNNRKVIMAIAGVPTYLVALFIVMLGFNLIFINNQELDKEKTYIEHNIQYTKDAYNINIEEIALEEASAITSEEIKQNEDTIQNINIATPDVVLRDVKNSQTAKGYYSYRDTSVQKYVINGEEQLLYISPREIVVNSSGTYNNKTYEYTHGFGAIITSATETNEDGTLQHVQKGFENNDVISITEPRIYYGMQTNDTVVTNSKDKKEFDYPKLDSSSAENAENVYDGEAGLKLNFLDRIILAIKEGDLKLAFSGNVTDESKILTNRNIINRAKTVMPYLLYDENPYMVITDEGKLVWVLDAYTTSNQYPYAQKTTMQVTATQKMELNYIRNSVKVLIDAYDGTIEFYITDRNDPIVMAYDKMYPELFQDADKTIPADITEHFVYPEYLYKIQADIIARYHNIQPDVLYRGDDTWKIATHNAGRVLTKNGTEIEPYYTMVNPINTEEPTLGLVLPYTPYGKQNLISYLIGTYDNSGNAKLTIYKYSADSNILGPMQLDTQLEQDETIAKEIESLNVTGTKIIKDLKIIPLENTLLYVEPIYQISTAETEEAVPVLKKVVVASGSKVAIGNTLQEALAKLVSQYAVEIEVENTDSVDDLVQAIIRANNNLTTSNNSNDWEMIGKDIKKLQELVTKLEEAVEKEEQEKNEMQNSITNSIANDTNIVTNEIMQ